MKVKDKLITGDVIYTTCHEIPFCQHLGIVVITNGQVKVFNNSPYIKNKYGGSICSETYESFMGGSEIAKIIRTKTAKENIIKVSKKYKYNIYNSLVFNCEDYILEIVDGEKKSDFRDAWGIGALSIIGLSLL